MKKLVYKYGFYLAKMYWFLFRPKSRGAICVIKNGRDILYVRHTYGKNGWGFPGGGIKKDESAENAVRRELKEELGVELLDLKKAGVFIFTNNYRNDEVHLFEAGIADRKLKLDEEEIAEAIWFDTNEPPQPLLDIAKRALRIVGK